MVKYRETLPWFAVVLAALTLPDSASASLRWRVDGHVCRGWNEDTYLGQNGAAGPELRETSWDPDADALTCAIPIGPATVDLGDGSHMLDQVNIRMQHIEAATWVATRLVVHDHDSPSLCTCGHTNEVMDDGEFDQREMPFDCGTCSYDPSWAASLHISRTGEGRTWIRLISVYD